MLGLKKYLPAIMLFVMLGLQYPQMSFEQSGANYSVIENETKFSIPYVINHGKLVSLNIDNKSNAVMISIQTTGKDNMTVDLPRSLIDATVNGTDTHFTVLVNGHGIGYKELVTPKHRSLTIPVPNGTSNIEIKGTQVIPEFGPTASLVLVISVIITIGIYRNRLGRIFN